MNEEKAMEDVYYIMNPDDKYVLQNFKNFEYAERIMTPYDLEKKKDDGFIIPKIIKEGQVITKHPYRNEYIYLDEEKEDEITLERIRFFGTILSYLGAKELHISLTGSLLNDEKKNQRLVASIGAIIPEKSIKGGLGFERQRKEAELIRKDLKIDSFSKWRGVYTKQDYKKALEIANQYGIKTDSIIDSMIKQRNPLMSNQTEEFHEFFDVRSDIEKSMSFSRTLKAKINATMGEGDQKTSIDAGGKVGQMTTAISQSQKQNSFEFKVVFGPLMKSFPKWIWWILGAAVAAIITGLLIVL